MAHQPGQPDNTEVPGIFETFPLRCGYHPGTQELAKPPSPPYCLARHEFRYCLQLSANAQHWRPSASTIACTAPLGLRTNVHSGWIPHG